jgi:peptidoglycan hydrolase CwlO-like protein
MTEWSWKRLYYIAAEKSRVYVVKQAEAEARLAEAQKRIAYEVRQVEESELELEATQAKLAEEQARNERLLMTQQRLEKEHKAELAAATEAYEDARGAFVHEHAISEEQRKRIRSLEAANEKLKQFACQRNCLRRAMKPFGDEGDNK